jgi:hypothetical protein
MIVLKTNNINHMKKVSKKSIDKEKIANFAYYEPVMKNG